MPSKSSSEALGLAARGILRSRLAQMSINEHYKAGAFKIPIHLAMGHEAIAYAVSSAMTDADHLICTHRNIHFNLARSTRPAHLLAEYLLTEGGVSGGSQGSMNVANHSRGVLYSSSILGNNLCVASGAALAHRVKGDKGVVFVATGDGAIEEGSFYESLLFQKSYRVPCLTIVENNDWSLGSKISERRAPIQLDKLLSGLDIPVVRLEGNDVLAYSAKLAELREFAAKNLTPVCVEFMVSTLGDWREITPAYPEGKYINYHAGPAKVIHLDKGPMIAQNDSDPVWVLKNQLGEDLFANLVDEARTAVQGDFKA